VKEREERSVVGAAPDSGADDVIRGLPKGHETVLGNLFEQGEELSIGEWQKAALSRAFLRDAQVIVLYEPTSSLDAKAEEAVFRNFRKRASGRTAILISHRFSTVRMANRIYVLKHGRIIEGGTHEELIHCGGTYVHLLERRACITGDDLLSRGA
jgi:ATP-binding cassette, subfamily B, bacterial